MRVVVPAKAATHSLRTRDYGRCKPLAALTRPTIAIGGYGSPPSRGRRVEILRRSLSRRSLRRLRQRRKRLAFGGEALQQRRRLQRRIVGLLGIIRQPVRNVLQADL